MANQSEAAKVQEYLKKVTAANMPADVDYDPTIFAQLKAPFTAQEIEWKVRRNNNERTKAMMVAYVGRAALMERLDAVLGPGNWKDEYTNGPGGGVLCGLSVRVGDEWVTKWDGAENTQFEAVKGGITAAFKRACYKWGLGRYLSSVKPVWVRAEPIGDKGCKPLETPALPAWALPARPGTPAQAQPNGAPSQGDKKTPAGAQAQAQPEEPKPDYLKMTVAQAKLIKTPKDLPIGMLSDNQLIQVIDAEDEKVTDEMKHAAALIAKSRHMAKELYQMS